MQNGDEERRRALLLAGLGLVTLGRHAFGTEVLPPAFLRLNYPVHLCLENIPDPWQTLAFDARCCASGSGQDLQLPGMLINLPDESSGTGRYAGFCLLCPHDMCHVDLLRDPQRIQQYYRGVTGMPMFFCPCHFSVFDPASDWERKAGPASRGLYRFKVSILHGEATITAVEAEALTW